MRDDLRPHGKDPKPSQMSTVDTVYDREASLEIHLIFCNSGPQQKHFQARRLTGKMYFVSQTIYPRDQLHFIFSLMFADEGGRTIGILERHSSLNPATCLLPIFSSIQLSTPRCILKYLFQKMLKGSQTNNLNLHLNRYMQGGRGSELSLKGDKRLGLLGWCGGCVGILSVVNMSIEILFWAEANERGSVHLKRSQLQPLCHAEIREEEEEASAPPVARLRRANEQRQAGKKAVALAGWPAEWKREARDLRK